MTAAARDEWRPQYKWPVNGNLHWGSVPNFGRSSGNSARAFFQIELREPATTIRREAQRLSEAEAAAWSAYQAVLACKSHAFERLGSPSGVGICKHCGLSVPDAFEPSEKCHTCGTPTYWNQDKDGNWHCEKDFAKLPLEQLPPGLRAYYEHMAKRNKAKG